MIKRVLFLAVLLGLLCCWTGPAGPHNPFTSKPETQQKAPEPIFKNPFFVKIILWQHQLKQSMSDLIKDSQRDRSIKPLAGLIGLAFLYGAIHAAGPGHGKVVAMSYVLSYRATVPGGVLFGICFAIIHALSGAIGVVGLRCIVERSVSETLVSVTTATQIVSFGLITVLGLVILIKQGYYFLNPRASIQESHSGKTNHKSVFAWALSVGLVPCPAVVMVMLFCLSMDAMILGWLLAGSISAGMAATISLVVIAIIMGKTGILGMVSKKRALRVEGTIGLLSGAAISLFGGLFFLSTLNAALY